MYPITDIRYTPSGAAVASFRIAVNEFWTDQGGQKQERTHWFSCVAWKHLAEIVNQYLSKGSHVGISGSLRQRTWQTDSGENRSTVEVVVRDLTMLDGKRREGAPPLDDGDIPF